MRNRKITTFITSLNQDFSKLAGNEKKLEEIDYGTLYHAHMLESSRLYIARMIHIDSNIFPPNKLDLTINLLSNNRYCRNLFCYQHTQFQLNKDKLSSKTEKIKLKLSPYIHISCTILNKDRTSLFHNELFRLDKGHLRAKNPSLPNLTISVLYNPKIDTLTKKIKKDFFLHDSIFPVFHLKKVAFLCLTPQILNINGKLKPVAVRL